jgi:hypothetical protein
VRPLQLAERAGRRALTRALINHFSVLVRLADVEWGPLCKSRSRALAGGSSGAGNSSSSSNTTTTTTTNNNNNNNNKSTCPNVRVLERRRREQMPLERRPCALRLPGRPEAALAARLGPNLILALSRRRRSFGPETKPTSINCLRVCVQKMKRHATKSTVSATQRQQQHRFKRLMNGNVDGPV